jgi:hypothetical protein
LVRSSPLAWFFAYGLFVRDAGRDAFTGWLEVEEAA